MHSDIDDDDFLDEDELSLGNNYGREFYKSQSEAPLKIGLNFIREDNHLNYLNNSLSMSLDHSTTDRRNYSRDLSQSMITNINKYTSQQIYKINSVNEKLRILLLYENSKPQQLKTIFKNFKIGSKSKILKKPIKQTENQFVCRFLHKYEMIMQRSIEPIKMNRIASIPPSKRKFYIKKSDIEDIQMKKVLKALTIQKAKQFEMKKGLINPNSSIKKNFQEKFEKIENILVETATQIEEQRVAKINEIISNQNKQTQADLKTSLQKYYSEFKKIHENSMELIEKELNCRQSVLHLRNVKSLEQTKKCKNISENPFTILSVANYMLMVTNDVFQDQNQKVNRTQLNLDSSFSKQF